MIGRLAGTLLEKNPPQILVDVQGVAYEVDVPMSTFYNLPATGERVTLFTHVELPLLLREAATRPIHRVEDIVVYRLEAAFLDAFQQKLDKNCAFEVVRSDGQLYLTIAGETSNGALTTCSLVPAA